MTALSADKRLQTRNPQVGLDVTYGALTNTTWYVGSMISRDANGYAIPSADTANTAVIGYAIEAGNSTGIASGTAQIKCRVGDTINMVISGATLDITDIGKNAIVLDDNTVQDAATGTNDIPAGIIRTISGSTAFVQIGVFGPVNA